ncbi:MAG: hypothetical protein PS018_09220 [bacterium]|nr:hypothetical protein [bacterium]
MSAAGSWLGNSNLRIRARLAVLPAIALAGFVGWILLPQASDAESVAATGVAASPAQSLEFNEGALPATTTPPLDISPPATIEAAKPPIDGLRISAQSWRRGGLGSKALVTFTLRNANDYAVKDIEVACAFARRDGSHLTDRRRVIADTVNKKSRKRYARMLVGFVNVNASKATCTPVAASRI